MTSVGPVRTAPPNGTHGRTIWIAGDNGDWWRASPLECAAYEAFVAAEGDAHQRFQRFQRFMLTNRWGHKKPYVVRRRPTEAPTAHTSVADGAIEMLDYRHMVWRTVVHLERAPTPTLDEDQDPLMRLRRMCASMRDWSPLGGAIRVGMPVVMRKTPAHGGATSRGIFASEAIPEGEYLGEYRGTLRCLPPAFAFDVQEARYAIDVGSAPDAHHWFIVGTPRPVASWARYINRPNPSERPNVMYDPYELDDGDIRVLIRTIAPIPKGVQLLVNYAPLIPSLVCTSLRTRRSSSMAL